MEKLYTYKVATLCWTYNHAKYIEDALAGFVIQQTQFPVVNIIIDDASTDGEPEIINNWANNNLCSDTNVLQKKEMPYGKLICGRQKNNENSIFVILLLSDNHYQTGREDLKYTYISSWLQSAQYTAMCEGDDFWTDPYKLQKECDYLDNHPEKSLVYTDCNVYFHDQKRLVRDAFKSGYFKKTNNYKDFFLDGKYLTPCSWLYKFKEYETIKIPEFATDVTLCKAFVFLVNDKVGYIDDTTCTYRVVYSGASHNSDMKVRYKYLRGVFETEKSFLRVYSDYFTEEDAHYLYNKRYRGFIPLAVAFNDKSLLKEIKDFHVGNMGLRNKLMLLFSWFPVARKYIYRRLNSSVQRGL